MRILIIEDDLKIAKSLADFFKNGYYAVDTACDGETGLHLALSNDYDLIITDCILPKISGGEIIKQLKKHKITTPILVMSVIENTQNKINFLEDGAADYLSKPFNLSELHARVKAILRRLPKNNHSKLFFADLTLDLLSHEAIRDGKSIYLTTKEFLMLRLFMEFPNFTHSRQIIIEKVWDEASNHFSNIIEAHILHLRHKIDFKKPFLIKTVPGRGYKLSLGD